MRRTVPVFSRCNGYTAPLQTVCGGGCVFGGLHARQRDAVPPLHRGAGLLHICHSLFCPPCPAPDSRFPIADFYLRQLPAFKLSCVNCNPSRAILCGTYLIIKGGAALCKFATGLFEAAVSCCNFAQGILHRVMAVKPCVNLQFLRWTTGCASLTIELSSSRVV